MLFSPGQTGVGRSFLLLSFLDSTCISHLGCSVCVLFPELKNATTAKESVS